MLAPLFFIQTFLDFLRAFRASICGINLKLHSSTISLPTISDKVAYILIKFSKKKLVKFKQFKNMIIQRIRGFLRAYFKHKSFLLFFDVTILQRNTLKKCVFEKKTNCSNFQQIFL